MGKSSRGGANPHFFCDSCGTEVPRDAKDCPMCGSIFDLVRCPTCDFVGEDALFKEGCPVCGFSSANSRDSGQKPLDFPNIGKPTGALPVWVYILTVAVFTAILAALFLTIFR